MLGLMEQDKLRPPRWMILGLPLICSGIAIFSSFSPYLLVTRRHYSFQQQFLIGSTVQSHPAWADSSAGSSGF